MKRYAVFTHDPNRNVTHRVGSVRVEADGTIYTVAAPDAVSEVEDAIDRRVGFSAAYGTEFAEDILDPSPDDLP